MKIAFVIVTYKTPESEVNRLVNDIKSIKLKNYKIFIIDNTVKNLGYAGGVNIGLKKALSWGAEIFIICNSDISFLNIRENAIIAGLNKFDILGGSFIQNNIEYFGGQIDGKYLSGGLITREPRSRFSFVDFVSGSFMVIKRKVIDVVGFFDESYFLYYEDVDYCLRASKKGFKIGIDKELKYIHFESSKKNQKKDYYLAKNHFRFFWKYSTCFERIEKLPFFIYKFLHLFLKKIKSRIFFVNMLSLNISSLINKLLNFILFAILVRKLNPQGYGVYSLVWAHVGLLAPILDMGTTSYGIVYLDKEKIKELNELFSLRFFLAIVIVIATLFLAFVFNYNLDIKVYILLASTIIVSNAVSGSFLIASSLRQNLYTPSVISVVYNIANIIFLVSALFLFNNLGALFFAVALVNILYSILIIYLLKIFHYSFLNFFYEIKKFYQKLNKELFVWKKILKQSYVFVLINLFAGLYFKADVFLLSFFKGQYEVGLYSAGYKFFEAFLFIAGSYNMSVLPVLKELYQESTDKLISKMERDLKFLSIFGILLVLFIWLISPFVLPLFLNQDYIDSINVLKIVVCALPLIFATSVFINSIYVLGKPHLVLLLFIIQAIVTFLLNVIFIPYYSFFACAYITIFAEFLNLVFSFIFFRSSLLEIKNSGK